MNTKKLVIRVFVVFLLIALDTFAESKLEKDAVDFDKTDQITAYSPDSYIQVSNYKFELNESSTPYVASDDSFISIPAVPEAEEWVMLLLGMPLVYLFALRKKP